jgi:hypothetical protein
VKDVALALDDRARDGVLPLADMLRIDCGRWKRGGYENWFVAISKIARSRTETEGE